MRGKSPVWKKYGSKYDALVKRILKELGRLANKEVEADEEHPYDVFWKAFGVLIKEGHYHDKSTYGERILPLLRFNTTTHADAHAHTTFNIRRGDPRGRRKAAYMRAATKAARECLGRESQEARTQALSS